MDEKKELLLQLRTKRMGVQTRAAAMIRLASCMADNKEAVNMSYPYGLRYETRISLLIEVIFSPNVL